MIAALFAQGERIAREAHESQDGFFSGILWLLVLGPAVIALAIAIYNKKSKQTVEEFGADEFEEAVLRSELPVLVHFYRSWSIGDQVMIAQVEKLATQTGGEFRVGFVDVEKDPSVLELYSHIEPPALLLFAGGRRVFHCEGVFDEADVMTEVHDAIERWRRNA